MRNNNIKVAALIACAAITTSSCTVMNKTMREPYSRVDFVKSDFNISEQVSGTATTTKVIGIDWHRLFHSNDMGDVNGEYGNSGLSSSVAKVPVVGSFVIDKTAGYALYDMMNKTPGYDIVFYPQFDAHIKKPVLGIGFFYKKTTVTAKARLAKFK